MLSYTWKIKARIRKLYDSSKYCYPELYREEQIAKYRRIIDSVKHLRFNLVLDAGCGPGFYIETASRIANLYICLDICRGMVDLARDSCRNVGNVEFVVADVDYPPFKDAVFDMVIAVTLLQNQPNPRLTLHRLTRLVKSCGIIAITFLKKVFTLQDILDAIRFLGLTTIHIDDSTTDYIAICRRS